MLRRISALVLGAIVAFATTAHAQTPFRHSGAESKHAGFSPLPNESVDPASGALTIIATDLVLPGNAGFDLRVTRIYNSSLHPEYDSGSTALEEDSWAGAGWRLHFGRVINPNASTGGETSIEMGDGSRHPLYTTTAYPEGWMTPGFARYDRSNHTLKVPNGYVYTFGHVVDLGGTLGIVRYVTEIRDPFNNRIEFSYFGAPGPIDGVSQIRQYLSATQVRYVDFTYDGSHSSLRTMSYDGRTWTYSYDALGGAGHSVLRQVQPPVGPSEYYDYTSLPGELTRYETPSGGVVTYTYQDAYRKASSLTNRTRVVTQRAVSGRQVTAGTWTFAYGTGSNQDTSVISCACGTLTYRFNGTGLSGDFSAWKSGTIAEQTIAEPNGPVLETRTFTWTRSEMLSPDPVPGESGVWSDSAVYAALLESSSVSRGSQGWTTDYEYDPGSFNNFLQPRKIIETGQFSRSTTITYQTGFGPHIIGRPALTERKVGVEGIPTNWEYDLNTGFLTSYLAPQTPRRRFTAHADGNLASEKDDLNNETTYENYSWGQPQIIRTPTTVTNLTINPDGTIASVGNGIVINTAYDNAFRPIRTWQSGVNTTFIHYDDYDGSGAWSEQGTASGGTKIDGFGQAFLSYSGNGVKAFSSYDACGRPTFTSLPYTSGSPGVVGTPGAGSTTTYDALGRPRTITGPDGAVTQFAYDGIDITATDAEGRTTFYDYSAAGSPASPRLAAVRDAHNVTTLYTYDVIDLLIRVEGPGPVPDRVWVHNGMRLMEDIQPESGKTEYKHDVAGNLKELKRANGQIILYDYDADNRLKFVNMPGGTSDDVTLVYDAHGRLESQSRPGASMTFGYNAVGQLASRTDVVGGLTFVSSYTYDLNDNLKTITYPSGRVIAYNYDAHNRLVDVRQNGSIFADQFQYDSAGRLETYRTGTVTHTLTYDAAGRTKTLGSGSALNLTYEYDFVGNVESITEPSQTTQMFGYDNLNRLTSASGPWGQRGWEYNASGDRILETGAATTSYHYDAATRRLQSTSGARAEAFGYNAVGEMTSDGRGTYTYNAAGLVTQFTTPTVSAAYSYDPSGLRVAKTVNSVTTYTVRSSGGTVLSEYRGACGTPTWSRDIIYAGGRLLGSIKATQTEPTVALSPVATTVAESVGTIIATITLTTPGGAPLTCPVTVSYQAVGTTASAGADFQLPSGVVTFNPGDPNGATRALTIAVVNDALDEADEAVAVTLANVTGGQPGANSRTDITITDDDPYPALSINDVSLYEGNAGMTSAVFTVTLSAASGRQVYVAYATSNGSALAGTDYQVTSGTLGFTPGTTQMSIMVPIFGDGAYEPNETLQVTLSAPSLATLGDAYGIGTIVNDDVSRHTWGDFYAPRDGSADAALFSPATGLWTFKDSNTGATTTFGPFGDTATHNDKFVPADYTGDGITDCATYRPATGLWTIAPSCGTTGHYSIGWGADQSDVPVPADFDGDGRADLAVYRRATTWWHVLKSTGGTLSIEHGWTWTPVTPVPGDYDGDGRADFAYYAEFNQAWVIVYSSTGTGTMLGWGQANIVPTPADFDGDGRTDLAYFNPATGGWHIVPSTTGVGQVTTFGGSGMVPVQADYDGDGKADLALYHPPYGAFYVLRSTTGTYLGIGTSGLSPTALPVLRKPQ